MIKRKLIDTKDGRKLFKVEKTAGATAQVLCYHLDAADGSRQILHTTLLFEARQAAEMERSHAPSN